MEADDTRSVRTRSEASGATPARGSTSQGTDGGASGGGDDGGGEVGGKGDEAGGGGNNGGATGLGGAASASHTPSATGAGTAAGQMQSKRRRGPGLVTPNACTECRKKRAKCDGHKPRCGRCMSQGVPDCIYEVPVRQSKETLRTHIEDLRQRQRLSEQVFSALRIPDLSGEVMNRIKLGQSVEIISDWLRSTQQSQFRRRDSDAPQVSSSLSPSSPFSSSRPGVLPPLNLGHSPVSAHTPTQSLGSSWNVAGRPSSAERGGYHSPSHHGPQQHHQQQLQHPQLPHPQPHPLPRGHGHPHHGHPSSARPNSQSNMMAWTSEGPRTGHGRVGSWASMDTGQSATGSAGPFRGLEEVLAPVVTAPVKPPASTWTDISDDSNLVQHLLALYFCWEYPTFASLSKEHFLQDFQDGRERYCSQMLVNALLALGCRFSTQPSTRENPDDPYSSGDHFFKESQRLLRNEADHHTLTTIQALGIMSIREASCGRDSESWYYAGQSIRLAIEMGLHRIADGDEVDETAVQSATFWGAFALDHAWSLATGSLPQCSCFPRLPSKPGIINNIEASLWIPYTDDGAPLHRSCEQPSNVRSVYRCFCELSELVHHSLYMLHAPGRPLTARDLLYIYTQYLDWYDRIPEVLRLGQNFTPAVLFAHMYYHFAILLLFRPLIKLRIVGSKVVPRDVCLQAADAIQGLLKSYCQLYTLQRTPSFVPYFVLTSSIMHLAIGATTARQEAQKASVSDSGGSAAAQAGTGPGSTATADGPPDLGPRVSQAISQAIADLTEMAPCHHFAEQALNILRYLAKKWQLDVDFRQCVQQGAGELRRQRPSAFGGAGPHLVSKGGSGGDAPVGTGGGGVSGDESSNRAGSQDEKSNGPTDLEVDYDRLVQPRTSSLNFFAPNVREQDFVATLARGSLVIPDMAKNPLASATSPTHAPQGSPFAGGGDVYMSDAYSGQAADTMDNPLFWPFPMQGRPILPDGEELERAGFSFW